jgi:hypothetical protein
MTAPEQFVQCGVVDSFTGRPCDRPAVHVVRSGCVHEHVRTAPMCAHDFARLSAGEVICRACYSTDDPHGCPMLGRVVGELVEARS